MGARTGQGLEDQQSQALRGAAWTARPEGPGPGWQPGPCCSRRAGRSLHRLLSCDLDFGLLIPGLCCYPAMAVCSQGAPGLGELEGPSRNSEVPRGFCRLVSEELTDPQQKVGGGREGAAALRVLTGTRRSCVGGVGGCSPPEPFWRAARECLVPGYRERSEWE